MALSAVPALAAACGTTSTTVQSSAKPKSLNLLWGGTQPQFNAVQQLVESKLGLKLNADVLPYSGLQDHTFSELAASSPHYDLLYVDTPWMPALVGKLEPLSGYINDRSLQDSTRIDLPDFIAKVFYDTSVYNRSKPNLHFPNPSAPLNVDTITAKGFDIFGMPTSSNALVMGYRQDLFENSTEQSNFQSRYGRPLRPPETWDEFVDVAQFFTRPSQRLYGTTLMPGAGDWATDDFKTLLACWGGDGHLISDDFKLAFDSSEAVAALSFYQDLIEKYKVCPPGVTSFSWTDVANTFGAGLTAMAMNYGNFTLNQGVKGSIAYALVPKKVTYGPHFGTWCLAVNSFSKNKSWAFRAALALTSNKGQSAMLPAGINPTRVSTYKRAKTDPAVTKLYANYYSMLGQSLQYGVGRPRLTNYESIDQVIWTAVNDAARGAAAPSSALAGAVPGVRSLLQQAGYIRASS
jgi:multiple sugar transport system substrate-binding protein